MLKSSGFWSFFCDEEWGDTHPLIGAVLTIFWTSEILSQYRLLGIVETFSWGGEEVSRWAVKGGYIWLYGKPKNITTKKKLGMVYHPFMVILGIDFFNWLYHVIFHGFLLAQEGGVTSNPVSQRAWVGYIGFVLPEIWQEPWVEELLVIFSVVVFHVWVMSVFEFERMEDEGKMAWPMGPNGGVPFRKGPVTAMTCLGQCRASSCWLP